MPSLYTIANGALAASADINQLVNTLTGSQNTPLNVKNTDPIAYTLQLENTDAAGKALLIYAPDSITVLARVQANGVVASPDGTAAAPVVTTTHAQTLTNKTLTSPHMTSLVVDSGGLTVTGGITSSGAVSSIGDNQLFKAATSTAFTLLIRPADDANTATNIIKIQNAAGSADVFTVAKTGLTVIGGGGLTVSSGAVSLPANSVSGAALSLGQLTNAIGADVTLNNTGTYFDGPSVAQGTVGTWFVSGTVVCLDTAGGANFRARLWDGTTTIASSSGQSTAANTDVSISMSGYLATPAGNLRISVEDATATTGKIRANPAGLGNNASYISAIRIG